ncbi:MAG: P-loop NTPase [Planctomycetota bacterium]
MPRVSEHQPRRKAETKHSRGTVVTIVSGKGGVGKTNLALNIGLLLQRRGVRTILLDADFDLANADILLNVTPRGDFADLLSGRRAVDEVCAPAPGGLRLVCGVSGAARHNGDTYDEDAYSRAVHELKRACDVLLVDCGAGFNAALARLALAGDLVLLTTTPEPTAVADGYATLKLLCSVGFAGRAAVVVNMAHSKSEAAQVARRLARVARDFLGLSVESLGFIPLDHHVPEAVRRRAPVCQRHPHCAATAAMKRICDELDPSRPETTAGGSLWSRVAGLFL